MTASSKAAMPEEELEEIRAYARQYRSREWRLYRADALILAENRCQIYGRSEDAKVRLHVHHSIYRSGLKAWEYPHSECIVLCAGCHGREHGKIMPFDAWEYCDVEDLEFEGAGSCELCGTDLRYLHTVTHPKWHDLRVGCDCADLLTGSTLASESHRELLGRVRRRKSFVESPRWHSSAPNYWVIFRNGWNLEVRRRTDGFIFMIDGQAGKEVLRSEIEAKGKLFDAFNQPKTLTWLKKRRRLGLSTRY